MFFCCVSGRKAKTRDEFLGAATDFVPKAERSCPATISSAPISSDQLDCHEPRLESVENGASSSRSRSQDSSGRAEEVKHFKSDAKPLPPPYFEVKDTWNEGSQGGGQPLPNGVMLHLEQKTDDRYMSERLYDDQVNDDDVKSQRPNWILEVGGLQVEGSVAGGRDRYIGSDADSCRRRGIDLESRDFTAYFHSRSNAHLPISAPKATEGSIVPRRANTTESALQQCPEEEEDPEAAPFARPGGWLVHKPSLTCESVISKRPKWMGEQAPSELSEPSHWIEAGRSALGDASSDEDEEKKTSPVIRLLPHTLLEVGGNQLAAHVSRMDQMGNAQLNPSSSWTDEEPSAAVAVQGGQESSPAKTNGGQSSSEVCPRPPSEVGDSGAEQRMEPPRKANKVSAVPTVSDGHDHAENDDSRLKLINESNRRRNENQNPSPSPGPSKYNRGRRYGSSPSASQSTHEDPVEGSPEEETFRSNPSTQSRVVLSKEIVPAAQSSSVEAFANSGRSNTSAKTGTPISRIKLGTFSFPRSPENRSKGLSKGSGVLYGGEGAGVAVRLGKSPLVRGISPSSGPENGGFADSGGTRTERSRDSSVSTKTHSRPLREHSCSGRDSGTEGGSGDVGGDKSERQTRRRDPLLRLHVPAKPNGPPLDGYPSSAVAVRVESGGSRRLPAHTSAGGSRGVNHVGIGVRSPAVLVTTLARDSTSSNNNDFKRARPSEVGDEPSPTDSEELIRDANNGRKSGSSTSRERPQHTPVEVTATTSSSQKIASPLDVRADGKSLRQAVSMESTSSTRSSQGSKSIISSSTASSSGSSQTKNFGASKATSSSKIRRSHSPGRPCSPGTGQYAQSTGSPTGSERDGEPARNASRPPPARPPLSASMPEKYAHPCYDQPAHGRDAPLSVCSLGKPIASKPKNNPKRRTQGLGTPPQRQNERLRHPSTGSLPIVEEACEESGSSSPRRKPSSRPPYRDGEPAMQQPKPRKRPDGGPLPRSITIDVPPSHKSGRQAGTTKLIDSALSSKAPVVPRPAHPFMQPRETPGLPPVETDDGKVEALAWLNGRKQMLRLREDFNLSRRKSSSRLSRSSSFDEGSMRSFQSRGLPMFSPERFNAGAGALSWGAGSYDDSWCTATESVYSGNTRGSSSRSISSARALSNRGKLMNKQLSQREKQSVDRLKINRSDVHFGYRPVRGSGSVYKAELNGEIRAAKVISMLHMSKDSVADVMDVFDAELLLLSQLSSPNIVKVFGASVSPAQLIVVSEFVEGGTLRDLLENPIHRKSLHRKAKVSIAQGVAAGMRSMYAHGMQHRRLSSHAVLLTHDWQAKISGAGLLITKEMVAYASDEEPDADKGLSWVSREVLAGAGFGEESDVYSFGIVLWEIMQGDGSLPYAGLSTEQVVSVKYIGQGPPIPRNCPQLLSRLMQDCWSNIPADRPSFSKICDVLDPSGTTTH